MAVNYTITAKIQVRFQLANDPRYAKVATQLKAMIPSGPVEKRPDPTGYDSIRDCLRPSLPGSGSAEVAARPGATPQRTAAYGIKMCEVIYS